MLICSIVFSVWSFGITLWELFSWGETPYRDIEVYQLKRHILNGHTMEKPPYANDNMYELTKFTNQSNTYLILNI